MVVETCLTTAGLCCVFYCFLTGGLLITPWFMIAGTEKYLEMERHVDDYVKGTIFYKPVEMISSNFAKIPTCANFLY
jgi:hypothetical protein